MLTKVQIGEFLLAEISKYLNKNISVGDCFSFKSFKDENNFKEYIYEQYKTLDNWIDIISKNDLTCYFDYSVKTVKKVVSDNIGFPWNNNIFNPIKPYLNGNITDAEFFNYYSMIDRVYPKVKEIIDKENTNFYGTEKFINALNKFKDSLIVDINNIFKSIKVAKVNCEHPVKDSYFNIKITFDTCLTYQQKNKFRKEFSNILNNKFHNVCQKENIPYYTKLTGFHWFFMDNGLKCKSTNLINLRIKANDWNALGIDELANFMPIMKKEK